MVWKGNNGAILGVPYSYLIHAPAIFVGILSLIFLANYFLQQFNEPYERNFLVIGSLGYALLQLAVFLEEKSLLVILIGYSSSLLLKAILLFGVHRIFVTYAKIQVKIEQVELLNKKLNTILGRTYHEITAPLRTIELKLGMLLTGDRLIYRVTKPTQSILEVIENNYNRLIAVVSASMKMYEGLGTNFDSKVFPVTNDSEIAFNNINTLIEVAIISLKDTLEDEESIKINRDYGKGGWVLCYAHEVTQVFYNILKNSADSFEKRDGHKIYIRTKVTEISRDEGTLHRFFVVEFADNGPGIAPEHINHVFEEGFSTKGHVGRGFGMHIVKSLTEKNKGQVVVMSPYDFSEFQSGFTQGTLIKLIFPLKTQGHHE
jgi:signal transduction histidine kinase